jgi:hypothetical protein
MQLTSRATRPSDYSLASQWWLIHNGASVPQESLSSLGVVVESEGKPVVMAWLYTTEGGFAWIEGMISDPFTTASIRTEAVNLLLEELEILAKQKQVTTLLVASKKKGLMEKLIAKQYHHVEHDQNHFVRKI